MKFKIVPVVIAALPTILAGWIRQIIGALGRNIRSRQGSSNKRAECCDLLPTVYPQGRAVEKIPELKERLKHIGTTNFGYSRQLACMTCGQQWVEESISVGHADIESVRKAK